MYLCAEILHFFSPKQWEDTSKMSTLHQRINKTLCDASNNNNNSERQQRRALALAIEKWSRDFNVVNVSTALSRLAKARFINDAKTEKAAAREEEEEEKTTRKATRVLLERCRAILEEEEAKSNGSQLEPRHLSAILWSLGKMRLVRSAADDEGDDDGKLGAEAVAVARKVSELAVTRFYEKEKTNKKTAFNAQEISNLFWASAKIYGDRLKMRGDDDCSSVVEEAIGRMQAPLQRMFAASERREWTTQGVSNVCWSLAKMSVSSSSSSDREGGRKRSMVWVVDDECDLNKAIVDALDIGCSGPPTKRFNAQEFANIAWAMAKFSEAQNNEGGREVLVTKMAHKLKILLVSETVKGRFESRHVANTFLAFAKVNQCAKDPKFWFKLKTLTKSVLENMNAHELSMVMVGVGLVNDSDGTACDIGQDGEENEELAYEVCRFFTRAIASYTDDANIENDEDETGKVGLIANVFWALAKLPKLLEKIARKEKTFVNEMLSVLQQSNSIVNMSGRQASTILWSLAKIGDVVGFEDTGIKSTFELFSRTHFSNTSSPSLFFRTKTDARSFSMILWAFSSGLPDVATNEYARDVFESAHKDLLGENFIEEFNARDLANVSEAFAKRLDTPEKVLKTIASRAAKILDTFNAQELLKFLGAIERAGGDVRKYEKLNELLSSKRTVKIPFPALGLVDESAIKLRSATPTNDASKQIDRVDDSCGGFGRQNTGVALWEGSRVLAEWISRLSAIDLHAFCTNDMKWSKLSEDGFITPKVNAREKFFGKGKLGVELGAGLGLPSIVASKLGANIIATDGTCIGFSSSLVSFFLYRSHIRSG